MATADRSARESELSRRRFLKRGAATLMAGYGAMALPAACRQSAPTPRKSQSIILIVIDTLRADHLGCYGYAKPTSRIIDAFSRDSMLFERCVAQASDTWRSCAAIHSGFLPHETGVLRPGNFQLPHQVETVAETLGAHGYNTAAVVSNYVLRRGQGFEQGFDLYDDRMIDGPATGLRPERIAAHTTDRAIELLQQYRDDPLFMWIHYQDPHGPYTPPGELSRGMRDPDQPRRPLRLNTGAVDGIGGIPRYQQLGAEDDYHHYVAQYDGEIRYTDRQLARLFETLMELGYYDEALLMLTSDHGEGMGEHDYYFEHGRFLYEGLTHVPLIVRHGDALTGRRTETAQHLDIVPTIRNFAGLEAHPAFRGQDLRQPLDANRVIYSEISSRQDGFRGSVVATGMKLIYSAVTRRFELYDLNADPAEQHDLSADPRQAKALAELTASLQRFTREDRLALTGVGGPQTLTEDERRKLRSLGYVK